MRRIEKEVQYQITNTYSTLNALTNKTKNVWIACHGLGFLSRYFIKYFETLDPEENYIIAPQASAKQYLHGKFTHVGASWLTKENTQMEILNVFNNLNAIVEAERIPSNINLIVLGFSQGVSVASRWVAQYGIACDQLVLYAGKVPREFQSEDFKHVNRVRVLIGDKDEYITDEILSNEKAFLEELFQDKVDFNVFEGTHEIQPQLLVNLINE